MKKLVEKYDNGEVNFEWVEEVEKQNDKFEIKKVPSGHKCWTCTNGYATKCEKIGKRLNIKNVHAYNDFINEYQIYYGFSTDNEQIVERFIVNQCKNYNSTNEKTGKTCSDSKKLMTIEAKRKQNELKKIKKAKEALKAFKEGLERNKANQKLIEEMNRKNKVEDACQTILNNVTNAEEIKPLEPLIRKKLNNKI